MCELIPEHSFYPKPHLVSRPDWLLNLDGFSYEDDLLIEEVYKSIDNSLNVAAAMGLRTVFDCASEKLGIDPSLKFHEKLKRVQDNGKLGSGEIEMLDCLIEAGNAAAHRGWRPSFEQLRTMIGIMEVFLKRHFYLDRRATQLKTSIPQRPKRKSTNKAE